MRIDFFLFAVDFLFEFSHHYSLYKLLNMWYSPKVIHITIFNYYDDFEMTLKKVLSPKSKSSVANEEFFVQQKLTES